MNIFNFSRQLSLGLLAFVLHIVSINASIVEIQSLEEVLKHVNAGDPNSVICALDVDFTLTRPTHPATDPENIKKHGRLLMTTVGANQLELEHVLFATAYTHHGLMEETTPDTVKELRVKAKVVGLTARYSGNFLGKDLEEHTLAQLESYGISFDGDGRTEFIELPEHRENRPVFNSGVIFCNGEKGAPVTKPQVLAKYIELAKLNVTKVMFIDDTLKHLNDSETFFKENFPQIEFLGFHYTKATKDSQRECTPEQFTEYLQELVGLVKGTSTVSSVD